MQLVQAVILKRLRFETTFPYFRRCLSSIKQLWQEHSFSSSQSTFKVSFILLFNSELCSYSVDFLLKDEGLALQVDKAIRKSAQDGWRANQMKIRKLNRAVKTVLESQSVEVDVHELIELVKVNGEY